MEEKIKVDENLLEQMLNDFISDEILTQYEFKYTEISYDFSSFDFYLKAVDLLRPQLCLIGEGYSFNTHILLSLNKKNVDHACLKGKEEFFKFLNAELSKSEVYNAYYRRLFK